MVIYRVQCSHGAGPYRVDDPHFCLPCVGGILDRPNKFYEERPAPEIDPKFWANYSDHPLVTPQNAMSGFPSLADLLWWFPPDLRKMLHEHGFFIQSVEVLDAAVIPATRQVVYAKDQVKRSSFYGRLA